MSFAMNRAKDQVIDLFDWWVDELHTAYARMLGRKIVAKASEATITIGSDRIGVSTNNSAAQETVVPRDACSELILSAVQAIGHVGSLSIRVHSSLALRRYLTSARLPAAQARAMAELDMLASTPLDPFEVHIVFTGHHKDGCLYYIVKRKTLAPALEAIRRSGASVGAISIASEDEDHVADRVSHREISPPTRKERLKRLVSQSVIAAFFVVIAGTYTHAIWRYNAAQKQLDEQIATAQIQAKLARSQIEKRQAELDQAATIRDEKQNSPSLVRIWAELTRVLPDDAWLTDLSAKGDELTINGFAVSAANLIGPLEASPLFASPDFTAPVVKVPGQEGERFAIRAKVGRP
jgi:general secretion pathway protein L